jgi:hypothetical protein
MPYGANLKFGIARQTNAGSYVTDPGSFHHIPLVSHDVGLEKQEVLSANLNGTFDLGAVYDGVSNIAGTIEVEPLPKALGALLTALVAQPVSTTSASLRTLEFLPRATDFSTAVINEPFSVYAQLTDSNSAELYYDAQFAQGEFRFSQGQLLRTRVTLAGGLRRPTGIGSLSLTLDTADLTAGFLWDVSSISIGGTGISNFSELSVAINENIEPLYTLNGSLLPYKYTRSAFREVTVQGTMIFDTRSLYNDFVAGTQRRLLVTARNTRVAIQSGYYPTLVLDVPQMKITQMKPSVDGPGEVSVPFQARGIRDTTSNYMFKATLTTTYAAGY